MNLRRESQSVLATVLESSRTKAEVLKEEGFSDPALALIKAQEFAAEGDSYGAGAYLLIARGDNPSVEQDKEIRGIMINALREDFRQIIREGLYDSVHGIRMANFLVDLRAESEKLDNNQIGGSKEAR